MSRWQLPLAYRDLDQPLDADALLELPRAISDPEEQAVFRDVLHRSFERGIESMRPIVLGFEAMTERDRRRCLDACRKRLGLPSTAEVAARARYEAANSPAAFRRRRQARTFWRATAGGGYSEVNEAEIERERRRDERRAAEDRQRREQREHEAAERAAAERARAEALERELPRAFRR